MQRIIQWIRRAKLKDWLELLDRLLPHVAIVISGMLIVFFLIDRVNKPMAFMTNEFHKRITFILAMLSIYLAVRRCAHLRAMDREAPPRQTRPAARSQKKTPVQKKAQNRTTSRSADTSPSRRSSQSPRYADAPRRRREPLYNTLPESDFEPHYTRGK